MLTAGEYWPPVAATFVMCVVCAGGSPGGACGVRCRGVFSEGVEMPSCFNADVPLCVSCGQLQPAIEPGEISRHNCDNCGKSIEVYRSDALLYQVACNDRHNLRQMNGVPVCTLCGYEPDPGP